MVNTQNKKNIDNDTAGTGKRQIFFRLIVLRVTTYHKKKKNRNIYTKLKQQTKNAVKLRLLIKVMNKIVFYNIGFF